MKKKSAAVWNYFLKDWNNPSGKPIDEKLNTYTMLALPNKSTTLERLNNQIAYLDLLMTLYVLSPDDEAEYYATVIENYIIGENVDTQPPSYCHRYSS